MSRVLMTRVSIPGRHAGVSACRGGVVQRPIWRLTMKRKTVVKLLAAVGAVLGIAGHANADDDSFERPYSFQGWLTSGMFGPRYPGDSSDFFALDAPAGLQSIIVRIKDVDRAGGYKVDVLDARGNVVARAPRTGQIMNCMVHSADTERFVIRVSTDDPRRESNYWLEAKAIPHRPILDQHVSDFVVRSSLEVLGELLTKGTDAADAKASKKLDEAAGDAMALLLIESLGAMSREAPDLDLTTLETAELQAYLPDTAKSSIAQKFLTDLFARVRSVSQSEIPDPTGASRLVTIRQISATVRNGSLDWDVDGSLPDLHCVVSVNGEEVLRSGHRLDRYYEDCAATPGRLRCRDGDRVEIDVFDKDLFDDDRVGTIRFVCGDTPGFQQSGSIDRFDILVPRATTPTAASPTDVFSQGALDRHLIEFRQITGSPLSVTSLRTMTEDDKELLIRYMLGTAEFAAMGCSSSTVRSWPDLVFLVMTSESMNQEERRDWSRRLPTMTREHRDKFRDILISERLQLDEIDMKYRSRVEALPGRRRE